MSHYSDKIHQADCAVARCDEVATTIKMVGGKPVWLCPQHAEEQK